MNTSIVIALPKIEDAKKIRGILTRHGFSVAMVCSTGANALSGISELDGGVLICGYRLSDMYYRDLLENLPEYFELLLLGSAKVIREAPSSVLCVEMPMRAVDLVNTVNMVLTQIERRWKKERKRPKPRSWKEQNYISNAKMLLMQRNHLSEEEAYRYIQKCSMDSGTNMVETAQMVLMLLYDSV
ncbi:MAG: ANTAR domain-containing protein [Clostridiales bacterium]|nr:ANTAR domain-containing protein [Clostridiales bacterium]